MNQGDGMVSFYFFLTKSSYSKPTQNANHGFSCLAILALLNSQNLCGSATTRRSSPAESFEEVGVEEKNLRPKEARQRAAESFLEVEDFAQVRPVGGMGLCSGRLGC